MKYNTQYQCQMIRWKYLLDDTALLENTSLFVFERIITFTMFVYANKKVSGEYCNMGKNYSPSDSTLKVYIYIYIYISDPPLNVLLNI